MILQKKLILSSFLFISTLANSSYAEESRLDKMISPLTNPVQIEDPRPSTELRPIYMYHKIPDGFITGSGDIQLIAVQARLALSDRLAIIATKDGYVQLNSDKVLDDQEGSANLAAGLKYAIHRNDKEGSIVSLGLRYELASGHTRVFQGNGDGIINPFISAAKAIGPVNTMASTQLRIPFDSDDSTFWDLAAHVDYPIGDFYPLIELNISDVIDAGKRIGLAGEGFDLVNFGSSAVEGKTTVTLGAGARYRVIDYVDVGVGYEVALTDHDDVFDWRITTDIIVRCPWS